MARKVAPGGEGLVTCITTERLLAGMRPLMSPQNVRIAKRLVADVATKALVDCLPRPDDDHFALRAGVFLAPTHIVLLLVPPQGVRIPKFLPAHAAHVTN